jgi:dCTP deaminase
MIITGERIKELLGKQIKIEPFVESRLNPNSYNLTLSEELVIYDDPVMDMKKKPATRTLRIPKDGYVLTPHRLYLARTVEYTETQGLVPMLEGRSSIGRLGLFVHVTAGFGDVGFKGFWTLEMVATHPIRVYPGVEICQIFYHQVEGGIRTYDSGKYQNNKGIQASRLYMEFADSEGP